jgi:hypothetical protein
MDPNELHPDAYPMAQSFVHAPGAHGVMGNMGGYPSSGEWPQQSGERPSIRPPAPSPLSSASGGQTRRNPGVGQAPAMPADELGIEESQYDTPAYLRRSRTPAGNDYASMSYRMPDK